jgi:glycosyltransferase involved in cell wall biosynthesis
MGPDISHPVPSKGIENRQGQSWSVAILLCTLNGARFLPQQLASFESQTFRDWRLFVSDDGSEDGTLALLADFQKKHGPSRVNIRRGPGKGFAANFLSLICDPTIASNYYALSDQDDIWDANKLERARTVLMNARPDLPGVYCSRTRLISDAGIDLGLSAAFRRPPDFRNALVQCIAGGNTMVLNEAARSLLTKAGPKVNVVSHDWWIYLVTTAVGGRIYYDPLPTVAYRIHVGNLIGSNRTFGGYVRRLKMIWKGRFKTWGDLNILALEAIQDVMLEENKKTLEQFRRSRNLGLLPRVCGLVRSRVYRQTTLGNIGLMFAAIFKRM